MQHLSGIEYLKAEIACKHDKAFEKKTWDERIQAFSDIDLDSPKTFKQASDPIGLRAASVAYQDTQQGLESGYMISLDACSSGLQLLALMVSCQKSFNLCGGIHESCIDSYTTIYMAMNLHGALTRKEVKHAIMTSFYGSTSTPEATFGENVDVLYRTMEKLAPGAWDLNLGLQELWDEVRGSTYEWTMPDNFHACIETQDKILIPFKFLETEYNVPVKVDSRPDFHKGLGPNLNHSLDGMVVREMFRRCMFSPKKVAEIRKMICSGKQGKNGKSSQQVIQLWNNFLESDFLSVRILDHLFEDTMGYVEPQLILDLLDSLPKKPFEMVSVHDCFRCHANYGNDLRLQYNTILADINDSNILSFMAKQVAHSGIRTTKVGKIPRSNIIDANYTLA